MADTNSLQEIHVMADTWDKVKKVKSAFQNLVDEKMQQVANKGAELGYPNVGAGLAAAGSTAAETANFLVPEDNVELGMSLIPVGKVVNGAKGVLKPLVEAGETVFKDVPGREVLIKAMEKKGWTGAQIDKHFDALEKVGPDGKTLWEKTLEQERKLKGIGTTSDETVKAAASKSLVEPIKNVVENTVSDKAVLDIKKNEAIQSFLNKSDKATTSGAEAELAAARGKRGRGPIE